MKPSGQVRGDDGNFGSQKFIVCMSRALGVQANQAKHHTSLSSPNLNFHQKLYIRRRLVHIHPLVTSSTSRHAIMSHKKALACDTEICTMAVVQTQGDALREQPGRLVKARPTT